MWDAVDGICLREDLSIHGLTSGANGQRCVGSLTAAMRVLALAYLRVTAAVAGHRGTGHGALAEEDNDGWGPEITG